MSIEGYWLNNPIENDPSRWFDTDRDLARRWAEQREITRRTDPAASAAGSFMWRCAMYCRVIQTAYGDGWAGPPSGRPQKPAKLIYVHNAGQSGANAQRAAADWWHWLREAYGDTGTTWRSWDGKRLPSGRVLTRPLWDEYTGRLQRADLARRDYPTGPLVLAGTYR